MGGITNKNPLLHADFIQGVADAYVPQPSRYLMSQYFPLTPVDTEEVKWDEQSPLNFGLTLPAVPGAESPIIKGGSMRQFNIKPLHFREKYAMRREETVAIRRLGTTGELASAQERVAQIVAWLRGRVQDRIEWMGWQAVQGRISINEAGVNDTRIFSIPAHLNTTLSGTARWNQAATANPVSDIMNFMHLSRGYGWQFGTVFMNAETARVALLIDQFRTFFRDALQGGIIQGGNLMTMDIISRILKVHMPQVPQIVIWDEGYYIERPITVHANVNSTSVTVDDPSLFTQGDLVTLVSVDSPDQQLMTLNGGPVGNTLNFLTPLTTTYKVGSVVRAHKKHIPDGRLVYMPSAPGAGVPPLGKTFLTPSEWAPGSLMNPRPGIFFEVHDHQNEDPKRMEWISGFSGVSVPQVIGMWGLQNVY